MEASPSELMTIVASRALESGDVCFVGIGAPSAACNLARLTHAPDLVLIYESGTIGARPDVLPLSIGDGELVTTAMTTVPVVEMFQYWLQGGRISKGFLGGAQIDRFANINTTVIGDYDAPRTRLPGGGGAPEIAAMCGEVFVMLSHSPRTFTDELDFVTSLGHGHDGAGRRRAGLTTAGPTLVITDLCVLRPDEDTHELTVRSLHPGVERRDVEAATGWPIRFADAIAETPAPTAREIEALRDLQTRTDAAHAGH